MSTEDVAAAVESDVAPTVQVLRLVNSAFFSAASQVTNVGEAITRLGLDVVRSVASTDDARCQRLPEAVPPHSRPGHQAAHGLGVVNHQHM